MKKILLTISTILALSHFTYGQAPQKMQYQAVARNNAGVIIANQAVGFKISIVSGSSGGTVVYSETHNGNTNNFGLVNLQLGSGSLVTGSMAAIDWSSTSHFVKIEMDATGGTNYQLMGTSQLLSVPYALHAKTAENAFSGNYSDLTNQPTIITSADDADADPANEIQTLSINGSDLTLSNGGGTVTLPIGGGVAGIITIDNTNFSTVTTGLDDIVNIQGTINLTSNYNKFNYEGMSISGGQFIGTGAEEIRFQDISVIKGVKFENIIIDAAEQTVFIGCSFTNVSDFGFNATFNGCYFNNCTVGSSGTVGYITNSEINNCDFNRVLAITASKIKDSKLGGDYNSSTLYSVGNLTGNTIDDTEVHSKRSNFTGNVCDDFVLYLYAGGKHSVTGNSFDDVYTVSGGSSHIIINMAGSAFTDIQISGNSFFDTGASPYINIIGTFTGSYNLIKITNNSFVRGSSTIGNSSSNVRLVATENSLRSVSLGISNGGTTIVRDNDIF